MVDTRDLKSLDQNGRASSILARGTNPDNVLISASVKTKTGTMAVVGN